MAVKCNQRRPDESASSADDALCLEDYPQLALLCWNRKVQYLSRADAFRLYEREWRHVDPETLNAAERALIDSLTVEFGGGLFNG